MARKFTAAEIQDVRRLYDEGASKRTIAAHLGTGAKTLNRLMEKIGIKSRSREEQLTMTCGVDITGQRFGRLVAIKTVGNYMKADGAKGEFKWLFKCDCGNETVTSGKLARIGHVQSCGCYRSETAKELRRIDITGERYGRLVALNRVSNTLTWAFRCDCGQIVERNPSHLKSGKTKSCGCLKRDVLKTLTRKDATGQTFNLLTAIEPVNQDKIGNWEWRFSCECGGEKTVRLRDVISGRVQSCGCLEKGLDNIHRVIDGTFYKANAPSFLYVYRLKHFPGYLKPGIDSTGDRADAEYGEALLREPFVRIESWLIEQATLTETKHKYQECPQELINAQWRGRYEVRKMPADLLLPIVKGFIQEMKSLGVWEFAARYVPMTAAQRAICHQRALAGAPSCAA